MMQIIDIIENDWPAAVFKELDIHTKSRGAAVEPAGIVADRRIEDLAFAQAGAPRQDKQIEMSAGKRADVLIKVGIAFEQQWRTAWTFRLAHLIDLP